MNMHSIFGEMGQKSTNRKTSQNIWDIEIDMAQLNMQFFLNLMEWWTFCLKRASTFRNNKSTSIQTLSTSIFYDYFYRKSPKKVHYYASIHSRKDAYSSSAIHFIEVLSQCPISFGLFFHLCSFVPFRHH